MELLATEWPYVVHVGLTRRDLELLAECFEAEAVLVPEADAEPGDAERYQAASAMGTAFVAMAELLAEAEGRFDAARAARMVREACDRDRPYPVMADAPADCDGGRDELPRWRRACVRLLAGPLAPLTARVPALWALTVWMAGDQVRRDVAALACAFLARGEGAS